MKAHQKIIREKMADSKDDLFGDLLWENLDLRIEKSVVKEISYKTAQFIINDYEWLGNMGTTEYAYGIFWQNFLGGAVCFGRTGGTNVYSSVCGPQYAQHAITLCRGACVHWAHEHAASKLISTACRMMLNHGYNIFIAYSDPEAGEVGTVYQASNWIYCGMTTATEKFIAPDGSVKDARLVSAYTRDRRGGSIKYRCSRAEQKQQMISSGYKFFKGNKKHRYVRIIARTRKEEKQIRAAIQWPVGKYPKRAVEVSVETRRDSIPQGEVQSFDTAPTFSLQV